MTEDGLPPAECVLCEKHRGIGPLVGPVIYRDDLLYVTHRATGPLGYVYIDTQRHVPHLQGLTDDEAAAVGRMAARLARGLRAELEIDLVHSFVAGAAVPHFHQHVFARHRGTPDHYAWWEQWPEAPVGDVSDLAARLRRYADPTAEQPPAASPKGPQRPDVRLEPMTEAEYADFRERSELSYATEIAASRAVPLPEARRTAAEDHDQLLPAGLRTPGHYLWTAVDGDQPVGDLWLHVEAKSDGLHAFGYGFEVRPELRRRGYGRAITGAAERVCREMDVVSIGLTVFGPNRAAQSLYEDLGFEATVLQMRKRVSPA